MTQSDEQARTSSGRDGYPTWVVACFATSVASFFVAIALTVILERNVLVVGSISTLGLTPFVYLISVWCLSATLLALLLGRHSRPAQIVGAVAAFFVVLAVVVVTGILGTAAHDAASTPLHRLTTDRGDASYLVRVGTALEADRLSIYRGEGRWFELVGGVFAAPDTERFAAEYRLEETESGAAVLVYPTRMGPLARVELPR